MKQDVAALVRKAQRVGTPIVAVTTADCQACQSGIAAALDPTSPMMRWDLIGGLAGINKPGQDWGTAQAQGNVPAWKARTQNPVESLMVIEDLPEFGVVFVHNAHNILANVSVAQAVQNLRDTFKLNNRMVVLLAPQLEIPMALTNDIVMFDEELPGEETLRNVVTSVFDSAGVAVPEPATLGRCVAAVRGLTAFTAEQSAAMSLSKAGMDEELLHTHKRGVVQQTEGLLFTMDNSFNFGNLAGLQAAKDFGRDIFEGPEPPRAITFIDELEKVIGGASGNVQDTSGVSQDALAVVLRSMEDYRWSGMLAVGHPGGGKTAFARALAATYSVPLLEVDLGACKGSLVGESERKIRQVMKVIRGIAGGDVFVIGTVNRLDSIPPELKRRFMGLWFFDLPDKAERRSAWDIHLAGYGLEPYEAQDIPDDEGWTGAEIRNVCWFARRTRRSLKGASQLVVPICKSDPESIERLCNMAHDRFLSASYPGPYRRQGAVTEKPPRAETGWQPVSGRKVNLDD